MPEITQQIAQPVDPAFTLSEISRQFIEVSYWAKDEQNYTNALIKYEYLKKAVLKLENELQALIPDTDKHLF
jgi:hypothetical protein